jgi:hypothetical protein
VSLDDTTTAEGAQENPATTPAVRRKPSPEKLQAERERFVAVAMCALATLQLAWFYVICVPGYLYLPWYEQGRERMPFQGRMLMEYVLRWAHSSSVCNSLAAFVASKNLWKPSGVLPEDLVEFVVDAIAIAVAGLVARDLYRLYSKTQRFLALVYPLVLVMVAATYCLLSSHYFHFVYDLPSLALFAGGLWLIARRKNILLFMALFVVATINRETSIFLLYFLLASAVVDGERVDWRRMLSVRAGAVALVLAAFWVVWHVWVVRHFAGGLTESERHIGGNVATILWPMMWPQLFAIAAYMIPVVLLFRHGPRPLELRLWMGVLPLWAVFMFVFGMMFEIRIFGELIPLLACMTALLADERLGVERTGAVA